MDPNSANEPTIATRGQHNLDTHTERGVHDFIHLQGIILRLYDCTCTVLNMEDLGSTKVQVLRMAHHTGSRVDIRQTG
jgi:hypothetical protein